MTKIYSRRNIIEEFIYSEYEDINSQLMEKLVLRLLRWSDDDFIEYINAKSPLDLVQLRKNTYYIR